MGKNKGWILKGAVVVAFSITLVGCGANNQEYGSEKVEHTDSDLELALPPGYNDLGPRSPNPSDPFDQGPYGQSIGYYAKNGKLVSAQGLPDEGTGFLKIMRNRSRQWATYDMIEVIKFLGNRLKADFPQSERLQVGDIAAQKGGKVGGHDSHQNGLDADVAYMRKNYLEVDPYMNDGLYESFVVNGKVTANFDVARSWYVMKVAYSTGRVKRMFVDQAIKDAFCIYAKQDGYTQEEIEILRRMQHVANHHDHFHMRISCPTRSPECQDMKLPAEGHSCRV